MTFAVGHEQLFGVKLSMGDIIEIISRYPVSFWLDICAKIESIILHPKKDLSEVQNMLLETFLPPSVMSRMQRKVEPGATSFSLGQVNLLRKLSIAYGSNGTNVEIPKVELSQVLLGVHDIHFEYDNTACKPGDLDSYAKHVLRSGYLNARVDFSALLARATDMYTDQASKMSMPSGELFIDLFTRLVGINPEEATALGLAMATPFFQEEKVILYQTTLINPNDYFDQSVIDSKKTELIISGLTADFTEVKKEILKELENFNPATDPVGYNLKIFRRAPFIRLEDGRLACVSLPCLLQKATQNTIWMPLDHVTGKEKQKMLNELTDYRGRLFGEYLKEICRLFERQNKKIIFQYIPAESTDSHEEVGDSILIQENEIVIFEAKSRQFNEKFKTTGDWQDDPLFLDELIIKGANQIETAAKKIRTGQVDKFPVPQNGINKIYPVLVTYEPVPMHAKMQRFVREKVAEAGLLSDVIFAPLEIMSIEDLERLRDAATSSTIIDLLKIKNNTDPHASETSFHNFFSRFLVSNEVISNGWNAEKSKNIWKQIRKFLRFKEEPSKDLI